MANEVMGNSTELQLKERVTETEKPQCKVWIPRSDRYWDYMGILIALGMVVLLFLIAFGFNYLFAGK